METFGFTFIFHLHYYIYSCCNFSFNWETGYFNIVNSLTSFSLLLQKMLEKVVFFHFQRNVSQYEIFFNLFIRSTTESHKTITDFYADQDRWPYICWNIMTHFQEQIKPLYCLEHFWCCLAFTFQLQHTLFNTFLILRSIYLLCSLQQLKANNMESTKIIM